jgi:hypothetical protein
VRRSSGAVSAGHPQLDRYEWRRQVCDAVQHGRLSRRALGVADALVLDFVGRRNGCAWPSQRLIGERAGMSERTAFSGVHDLVDAGFLEIAARGRQGGGARNLYRLTTPSNDGGNPATVAGLPGGRGRD